MHTKQSVGLIAGNKATARGEVAPGVRIQQFEGHPDRLGFRADHAAPIGKLGDLARRHLPITGIQPRPGAVIENGVDLGALRYANQQNVSGRAILQVTGDPSPLQTFDGRQQMGQHLAAQFVSGFRVFRQTQQALGAFRLCRVLNAERQQAALGICKGTNGFQRLAHHLAGYALGFETNGL
jgi:hypothetical protein